MLFAFLSSSVPLVLNQLYKVAIALKVVSFMNRFSWIKRGILMAPRHSACNKRKPFATRFMKIGG